MDISLNEVEAQATKAARGAGFAWGHAEDIGHASRWLAERGVDWPSVLLQLLADTEAASAFARASPLADGAAGGEAACAPLWTIPLLAMRCRARGAGLSAQWPTLRAGIGPDGAVSLDRPTPEIGAAASPVRIEPGADTPFAFPFPASARRGHATAAQWRELDVFVSRTYVPSSLQSRAAGAGSGLTDND